MRSSARAIASISGEGTWRRTRWSCRSIRRITTSRVCGSISNCSEGAKAAICRFASSTACSVCARVGSAETDVAGEADLTGNAGGTKEADLSDARATGNTGPSDGLMITVDLRIENAPARYDGCDVARWLRHSQLMNAAQVDDCMSEMPLLVVSRRSLEPADLCRQRASQMAEGGVPSSAFLMRRRPDAQRRIEGRFRSMEVALCCFVERAFGLIPRRI